MEEVLLRFDHIGKQIFARLENKDLAKCRETEKSWKKFIDQEDLPWIRIVIQKYSCQKFYKLMRIKLLMLNKHKLILKLFLWI